MPGGVGEGGGREDRAQGRADAGRPGDREGGAGDDRAALSGPLEERVDVPLAVEPGDEERGDEEDPHRDDQRRRDLGQRLLVILEEGAEAGGGQSEEDEDRREAGDEEQARDQDPAPAGVVEVGRGDAADRGEVARHQRQHAGREERDDARAEGGEDRHPGGGVRADLCEEHPPRMAHGRLQNFFRPWEAVPMRIKVALSLVLSALVALFAAGPAQAALTVTNQNDSGAGSLRQTVIEAPPGETVVVPAGKYTLTSDPLEIVKSVTIAGHGSGDTTIRAGVPMGVFEVTGPLDATISGVTIRDGNIASTVAEGAGIQSLQGNLTLRDVVLTNNTANANGPPGVNGGVAFGGAIWAVEGSLTLIDSTVTSNAATAVGGNGKNGGVTEGGGIWLADGPLTIENTTISGNRLDARGGQGPSDPNQNGGVAEGGGIWFVEGGLSMRDSHVDGNTALATGGAGDNGGVTEGGGLWMATGNAGLANTTFNGNQIDARGGQGPSDPNQNGGVAEGGGIWFVGGSLQPQQWPGERQQRDSDGRERRQRRRRRGRWNLDREPADHHLRHIGERQPRRRPRRTGPVRPESDRRRRRGRRTMAGPGKTSRPLELDGEHIRRQYDRGLLRARSGRRPDRGRRDLGSDRRSPARDRQLDDRLQRGAPPVGLRRGRRGRRPLDRRRRARLRGADQRDHRRQPTRCLRHRVRRRRQPLLD